MEFWISWINRWVISFKNQSWTSFVGCSIFLIPISNWFWGYVYGNIYIFEIKYNSKIWWQFYLFVHAVTCGYEPELTITSCTYSYLMEKWNCRELSMQSRTWMGRFVAAGQFFRQYARLRNMFKSFIPIWTQMWVRHKAVLSVGKQLTDQLPEGCFGPTKYDNSGTFTQICLWI